MTTRVIIINDNYGAPYADWDVEIVEDDKVVATLKPGEQAIRDLWHDGRALMVREKPKS